jgi:hypothetical protein
VRRRNSTASNSNPEICLRAQSNCFSSSGLSDKSWRIPVDFANQRILVIQAEKGGSAITDPDNAIPNPTAADCLKTIIYRRFKFPCNCISREELPMAIS